MSIEFTGKKLIIDGHVLEVAWPILDVAAANDYVFVLLDPDAYLADASYRASLRDGGPAIRNLVGFSRAGQKLWEAEIPEQHDYYYRFHSVDPLSANSFSSFRCAIDPVNGKILAREFLK